MTSFAELGLSDAALHAVDRLGYENPTPVQEQAIPHVLAGRDLIAAASTGTGKTVTLKSNQYTGSVRTGLKKNATYYVRIRTYKRVSGKTYYSDWSKVKSFKVVR